MRVTCWIMMDCWISGGQSTTVGAILQRSNVIRYGFPWGLNKNRADILVKCLVSQAKASPRTIGVLPACYFRVKTTSCEFSHTCSRPESHGEHGGRAALARLFMASGPRPRPPTSCSTCTWTSSREWWHALHQLPPPPHTGKRVQEEAV